MIVTVNGWFSLPEKDKEDPYIQHGGRIGYHKSGAKHAKFKAANPDIFLGWKPTCSHDHTPIPSTILDPFVGSGTTVQVARALGRQGIGIDLSADYLQLARQRLELDKLDDWGKGIKDEAVYEGLPLFGNSV